MCGRFIWINVEGTFLRFRIIGGPDERPRLQRVFGQEHEAVPRWNIAPKQDLVVIHNEGGTRQAEWMEWGLRPSWAKADQKLPLNINARDDRLLDSGMWRGPIRRSRCVIPADGFYEWQKVNGAKLPYFIRLKSQETFGFAGLYDTWHNAETGEVLRSCAIVTTSPNTLMEPIHDRMPAILDEEAVALWLDPATTDPKQVTPLIKPYPAQEMEAYRVSDRVNNWRNEGPDLLRSIESVAE
jgi:putative SOS response-associated peptidase YedK